MAKSTSRKYTYRYSLYGVLFGLCFPVFSTLFVLVASGYALTPSNLILVQKENPLLWVIDTAPFFLGLVAGIAGRRQDQITQMNTMLKASLTEHQQMVINLEFMQKNLEHQIEVRTRDLDLRKRQLEAAARIARDAAEIYDLERLLNQAVLLISQRLGFYHTAIFLLNKSNRAAVLKAASSEGGQALLAQGHRLEVGKKGIVGYVASTGEPRIALDVGKDAVFFDNPNLPETRSELALPLIVRDEVIGVLDVQSQAASAFSQEDVEILQILADQIALGIGTARLIAENQASMDALKQSYRELTRDVWGKTLSTQSSIHYECDADGNVRQVKSNGKSAVPIGQDEGISLDGTRLSIPVQIRGRVVGSVDFQKPPDDPFWSADEISLLETLTSQVSLALDSARLFTESQRKAARERLVAEITSKIRASNDPDQIIQTAVTELQVALNADRASYKIRSENNGEPSNGAAKGESP